MIKKLFGGKSDGFFLELDESDNSQATETKTEEKQPEPVAVATEEQQPEVVEEKSAKKSTKTSIKDQKKTSAKTTATPSPQPTPVSAKSASSGNQPSWVKTMYNTSSSNGSNGSNGQAGGGEQTFAPNNLLPTPSAFRRRPGPSLNKFKEMARQAKIRRR